MNYLAHICVAKRQNTKEFQDPRTCRRYKNIKEAGKSGAGPDQIVFSIIYPHPGLTMSRYHQFIAASLNPQVEYSEQHKYGKSSLKSQYCICTLARNGVQPP